jgi:phosphoglycerate dehydrogenase-like enzyme
LDVFDADPLPPAHPLTKLPDVVLTSHLGWPTDEMYSKFADAAADVLLAYLDGREVPRFVGHQAQADVVVVGSGHTGLSASLTLLERPESSWPTLAKTET